LSHEFFKEILDHPIPTDMEAAKALSSSPEALDLFTWLSYRCFVAKGREHVPLFGETRLVNQLGSADYRCPRKFRERLEGWLDLVRALWPECPAGIDENRTGLCVDRAHAVLMAEGGE
jgi:Plasmid encoded RepA protein